MAKVQTGSGNAFYDYDVEAEDLRRKQAILDAMQGQSMQAPEVQHVGGMAGRVSPLQVMGKLLQAYSASKGQEALKAERQQMSERAQNDLRTGLGQYYKTSQGYEAPSLVQQPNPDGTPKTVKVAGDSRKAIFDAMSSNHPLLRQMAMSQLQNMKPSELKEVGGVVYDPATRQIVKLDGPQPTQKIVNGDLYELNPSTGQWRKLDNAAKVSTNVNVGGPVVHGQKAGMGEYFRNAASQVDALGKVAQTASNIKQTLAEMRNLDAQGIFSNVTTGAATFLTNLGQAAGVKVDTSKLGNTEAFNALATDLWQGLVAKFGGNRGVTQQEAAEIKKMMPLAAFSPEARQQLYTILNNVADRQIAQYQNANKAFAEAALKDDPTVFSSGFGDVYVPAPSAPAPTTPAANLDPSVTNW